MARTKYIFNTKTLAYEELKRSRSEKIARTIVFLLSSAAFAIVIIVVSFMFFKSPKERMLERELEQYKLQTEIFNNRIDKMQGVLSELTDKDDNIYRIIFEAEPISKDIRQAGYGGAYRYAALEGYNNSDLLISTAKKLDKIASQIYVQSKSFDEVFEMAKNKEKMLASLPAIQPVNNKDLKRIASYFGMRIDPIYKVNKFHKGIDFSAPKGTPIFATGDGIVIKTRKSKRGYGNTTEIDHGYGYHTFYAHQSEILVKKGQKVSRGQIIGKVGNTGKSTAPHLHYEVKKNGRVVNPIYYFYNDLTPEEYELLLDLSKRPSQSLD